MVPLKRAAAVAPVVMMAACGGISTAPAALTLAATVSDPAGDTTPRSALLIAPDLVAATIDISDGNLTATVTFAPGTMSQTLTLASIVLDVDENPATGSPGVDADATDSGLVGVDYVINAVRPLGSGRAQVLQSIGVPNEFIAVASVAVAFPSADQLRVTVPLSLLGNDDGRMNFKVTAAGYLSSNQTTGVTDYMPNAGLPPAAVR